MDDFKKRLIFISILLLVVILISGGLFYYFHQDIIKKTKQIDSSKKELASRSTILNRIYLLQREYEASVPYLEKLKNALPTETEIVNLEESLKNLAEQNNLDLSFRFGLLNEGSEQEPKNYSFNLVLSGKSDNILKWFDGFQKLTYSLRLEQIELISSDSQEDKLYRVKILGRIYLR